MRWISKDEVEECLKVKWRTSAASALAKLKTAITPAERKTILKTEKASKVWRDFYKLLPAHLKKKCWYCEAEEIRSDMPVDHFRPKSGVEEDKRHTGYWWLAFDWENYRCACSFCNSRHVMEETAGGKQSRFPLENPKRRAYTQTDNIDLEEPYFLDPFNVDDEKLLWFDADGVPEPCPGANATQRKKVQNSIDIFHLHEGKIARKRNNIRISIAKLVKDLKQYTSDNNKQGQKKIKQQLKKMIRDTEMLSRAAVVYLRAHRDIPEVKDILQID